MDISTINLGWYSCSPTSLATGPFLFFVLTFCDKRRQPPPCVGFNLHLLGKNGGSSFQTANSNYSIPPDTSLVYLAIFPRHLIWLVVIFMRICIFDFWPYSRNYHLIDYLTIVPFYRLYTPHLTTRRGIILLAVYPLPCGNQTWKWKIHYVPSGKLT